LTDLIGAFVAFLTYPTTLLLSGGALGTWARYGVSAWFKDRGWGETVPWGTFAINVTGSLVLGAAFVLIDPQRHPERGKWLLLLGTGFCGGYTTFSTFSLEMFELALVRQRPWLALAYAQGSVIAGFAGAAVGWLIAGAIASNTR
jgi:CrcB protein